MTAGAADDYLWSRLRRVERRVREVVDVRRTDDPAPDDPFRGLYVNDETVDRLLEEDVGAWDASPIAPAAIHHGPGSAETRLGRLERAAGLTDLESELLMVALLPDLDSRFERLYGYLNDDVTRRRASVGLALELAGASTMAPAARASVSSTGPLVSNGLLLVEDLDRPFLTRALRVPDRVTAHLLGDDRPDAAAAAFLAAPPSYATAMSRDLAAALDAGVRLVHVRERESGTGVAMAVSALTESGRPAVVVELARLANDPDLVHLGMVVAREALLRGAGLVAGPVEQLAEVSLEAVHRLTAWDVPMLFVGSATWDPRWSSASPLTVDAPVLGAHDRVRLWRDRLGDTSADLDPEALPAHLSLGPGQVDRAIGSARAAALLGDGLLTPDHLRRGVRAQNAAGLERLARRIEPEVDWSDLVIAPWVRRALRDLSERARYREIVLTDWRMRRGGGRGRGVTALFAGDSGTGKTMSAEVIAGDLGLDLYTVNLATVVDKYVGETEKNLERIFTEAGGVNAVLFFDEADAIFGKRSDVRDAHDRYANIESAYLLQRLETFDGLAILATNLRANIDEAFTRRLDAIIDFPAPTPELRERLWRDCLTAPLPVGADIDFEFCARSFELTGGNIRSASITAAYLAAASNGPVGMAEVITAVVQEYRKLGRLVLEREFGEYLSLARRDEHEAVSS